MKHQRPAAVLVLALLLMGAIVGSGIALSTVIASANHQTAALNDFIQASTAADGGLERALAVVKTARASATLTQAKTGASPASYSIGGVSDTISAVDSPTPDQFTWAKLLPGQSVTFDLLNSNTSGLPTTFPDTLTFSAQLLNSSAYATRPTTFTALDVSWIALDKNGNPSYSGRQLLTPSNLWTRPGVGSCPAASTTYCQNGAAVNLLTNIRDMNGQQVTGSIGGGTLLGYRVRITAPNTPLGGQNSDFTLINLAVQSSCSILGSCTSNFPSRITITSTAKVNSSQAQKIASVPWQLPATPVFNYVLFTEGSITPN